MSAILQKLHRVTPDVKMEVKGEESLPSGKFFIINPTKVAITPGKKVFTIHGLPDTMTLILIIWVCINTVPPQYFTV